MTCDMFDMWWIISTMRRQLLFRQFRDMARLPVYCLHTKISFKQTNIPVWNILLLSHSVLLKKGTKIVSSIFRLLQLPLRCELLKLFCCQYDTLMWQAYMTWHSSYLKVSFSLSSFSRRDYNNFSYGLHSPLKLD